MKEYLLRVGVIADDFTGASDAASYLRAGGYDVKLVIFPYMDEVKTAGCDAVVVALKSRSQKTEAAVRDCLAAAQWLKRNGAEKLYFKYCSTFDSTPEGNIGPVADALMETFDITYTLLCPALLDNGRSVRNGVLYVDGIPLSESHMKHHPLNPMWDSRIEALMAPQSKYPVFVLRRDVLADPAALNSLLEKLKAQHPRFYLVPDDETPEDGWAIAKVFGGLDLLTGGSELLMYLVGGDSSASPEPEHAAPKLGRLMFCGSCSDMTQRQVSRYLASGGRGHMIVPEDGDRDEQSLLELASLYLDAPETDCLYYSSGSVGMRDNSQTDTAASAGVERALSRLSEHITERISPERIVVAGGETSGAVTQTLQLHVFTVGDSVAPGIPVLYPQGKAMRLVLKSGNFGDENFFLKTLET